MVGLGNVPVNDVLELTSEESSFSAELENHEFVELLYGPNFSILAPYTPSGDSELGLDFFNYDGDSHMSDTVTCAAFRDHAEYN